MPALNQPEDYDIEMADYDPLRVALGGQARVRALSINLEVETEQFSSGRELAKTGMNSQDAQETNLKDTRNVSLSGDLKLSKSGAANAGVGYFQGNVGDATFLGQGGKDNLGVSGMRFGSFEGMDRFALAAVTS